MPVTSQGLSHIPPLPGHSLGHVHCEKCEASRQAAMHDPEFAQRIFCVASEVWLESRIKIAERTRFDYKQYLAALNTFFGQLKLCDIHIGHIRQYQIQRSRTCGPVRINHELCALIQILKRASLWGKFDGLYECLPVPDWRPPKILTDEEEQRFFQVASSREEWRMWYAYSVLADYTGLRGCEMRSVRLADIDVGERPTLAVCRILKTKRSLRKVPLVSIAVWVVKILLQIAASKGSVLPHHCLFPIRIHKGLWNPDKPMTNCAIGKPWREMRKAAGIPDNFTPHGWRHQFNTKMYEAGTDDNTVMEISGHENKQTSLWYSHIRDSHKREAMEKALCPKYGATSVENRGVQGAKAFRMSG